jgi:hypothetical protein
MPFTASHIAAVLPATRFPMLRDPLILSAFVIGTMSPDVPYFIPFDIWWAWGHNWVGLFVLDVPVTLALVAIFWLVLAAPLRALAPVPLRARLPHNVLAAHRAVWPRSLALLAMGAAIGAATHILWDAFTHEGRFGVMAVPMLQEPDVVGPLAMYRVLQYGSSAVGLALIAWSLLRWYQRTPASANAGPGLSWRWQFASAVSVIAAGLFAWWSVRGLVWGATDLYGMRDLLYSGLTRSVAGITFVVFVAALLAQPNLHRIGATTSVTD